MTRFDDEVKRLRDLRVQQGRDVSRRDAEEAERWSKWDAEHYELHEFAVTTAARLVRAGVRLDTTLERENPQDKPLVIGRSTYQRHLPITEGWLVHAHSTARGGGYQYHGDAAASGISYRACVLDPKGELYFAETRANYDNPDPHHLVVTSDVQPWSWQERAHLTPPDWHSKPFITQVEMNEGYDDRLNFIRTRLVEMVVDLTR